LLFHPHCWISCVAAGAKVGITVESGRLVVEPDQRPRYTLEELLANVIPKPRAASKSANGS